MKRNHYFLIGLLVMLIPYGFWFALGEDSFVLIHDNLDSEFVYIQLLLDSGNLFGFDFSGTIPEVMNGLDRAFLRSGFNITFLIFSIFSPIYAYIVHHLVVHLIAFVGMFLLLNRYVVKNNYLLVTSVAVCFGFLSFYHIQYGISIAGQPLLLFAFLNVLHKKQRWYDWAIIMGFPFFSFLVVTLPFYIPTLGLMGLLYDYKHKTISYKYYLILALLCVVNILVEFNLLRLMFFDNDVLTHRVQWNKFKISGYPSWDNFIFKLKDSLTATQYHAGYLYALGIYIALLYALLFNTIKFKGGVKYIILLILSFAFWYSINGYFVLELRNQFDLVNTFNSERTYLLMPMLWLLLLTSILNTLNWKQFWHRCMSLMILIFIFTGIVSDNKEWELNYRLVRGQQIYLPTYSQFFATNLFKIFKERHLQPLAKTRTVSVGIHPQIGLYNGLYSLDAYQNNYELLYKNEFRKIIAVELDKNSELKNYFDYWGSRCYVFSSELETDFMISKSESIRKRIQHLDINMSALRDLGGTHIISATPIENNKSLNLKLLEVATSETSYWKLYLYQID